MNSVSRADIVNFMLQAGFYFAGILKFGKLRAKR